MLNICIVGYGAIGPVHASAIEKIDNANIYAICDIDKKIADNAARKHNAKAFYNFDECLSDDKIDFVHICTPHYLHFEMITKALEAGKKVVVEKPVVMKKTELDILVKNYDTTKIYPVFQNRTNACIMKLKELLTNNTFGDILGIKGIVTWSRNAEYYNSANWRGTLEYEGGGALINQSIHVLDLMIYLAGEVKSISTVMQNNSLKGVIEVEDTVNAYLTFKNGARGIFYATNAYTKNSPIQLEIDFKDTTISYINGKLYVNEECICNDSAEYNGKIYWGCGHTKLLNDLYANNSSFCLAQVEETMRAMFEMYENAIYI